MYWEAKLMIMDEPTNNLGVIEQRKVLDLIERLRSERMPVILISHTLPDVFAVTDRIIVMHRGRKVAEKRTGDTNSQEIVQDMVGALDDSARLSAPRASEVFNRIGAQLINFLSPLSCSTKKNPLQVK
jgi:ABC-type sugar transport system ATPase subunit